LEAAVDWDEQPYLYTLGAHWLATGSSPLRYDVLFECTSKEGRWVPVGVTLNYLYALAPDSEPLSEGDLCHVYVRAWQTYKDYVVVRSDGVTIRSAKPRLNKQAKVLDGFKDVVAAFDGASHLHPFPYHDLGKMGKGSSVPRQSFYVRL
jgi:hypothetical protein